MTKKVVLEKNTKCQRQTEIKAVAAFSSLPVASPRSHPRSSRGTHRSHRLHVAGVGFSVIGSHRHLADLLG